jgi:hypothetical protein|eukprot:COSAG06_NODE_821_length_12096_cov_5.273735_8_plen_147_part_00
MKSLLRLQARAVKAALAQLGVRAYLCEDQVRVGGDWVAEISDMMEGCSVMVVLATATYGAAGTSTMLGTWEELEFGMNERKQMCIVRMCDEFSEPKTKMVLGPRQAILWTNEVETLPKIVADVQQKLEAAPAPVQQAPEVGIHGYQ